MSTTAIAHSGRSERRIFRSRTHTRQAQIGRVGIGTIAVVAILVSAWGGIIPFVGPIFGYSADGSGSWHWNLAHAVLALLPGAVGLLTGLLVLFETRGVRSGRGRLSLTMTGFIAMVCGAWFVVGPPAWSVLTTHGNYFAAASPFHLLENEAGYSWGTGLVLAACGAFVLGWASRHQLKPDMTNDTAAVEATSAPAATAATAPATANPAPMA